MQRPGQLFAEPPPVRHFRHVALLVQSRLAAGSHPSASSTSATLRPAASFVQQSPPFDLGCSGLPVGAASPQLLHLRFVTTPTQRDGGPPLSTPPRVDLHGKPDAAGNPTLKRAALAASRATQSRHQTRTVCLGAEPDAPFIPFGRREPGVLDL